MEIRNTQQIFNKNAKTAGFNCIWNIFVHTYILHTKKNFIKSQNVIKSVYLQTFEHNYADIAIFHSGL